VEKQTDPHRSASGHGGRGVECRGAGAGDWRQYISDFLVQPAHVARAQGGPQTGRRACAELRAKLDVGPLVIHTSYLVNVCSQSDEVREKSVAAFRGEIERALVLGAEYLVLHPGSWKGLTRDEGLKLAADSITRAIDGLRGRGPDSTF
jgi:endonuclease IV